MPFVNEGTVTPNLICVLCIDAIGKSVIGTEVELAVCNRGREPDGGVGKEHPFFLPCEGIDAMHRIVDR